ncbi:MAG: 1-phosphofructokinase [Chloroflexota bacterium]
MIITLTLNPAVDQTVFVRQLAVGEVNRFHESQLDPAGKGINVSRVVHRLGWPTLAFGFLAGELGAIVERALDDEGVQNHFVRVDGQTRANVTIVDESTGVSTSLYGPGPDVEIEYLGTLDRMVEFWLQAGTVLVLAGSLPGGVPTDVYAYYIRQANARGIKTFLDADGEALRSGIAAGPYLIKPNVLEAERLLGRSLPDLPAVVAGARELLRAGVGVVVISMGAQGSVCVTPERAWRAVPPSVERRSTVGSGDSLVAGLAMALSRGETLTEGLRLGSAAGAATAMTTGTQLATAQDVRALLPRVEVEELAL